MKCIHFEAIVAVWNYVWLGEKLTKLIKLQHNAELLRIHWRRIHQQLPKDKGRSGSNQIIEEAFFLLKESISKLNSSCFVGFSQASKKWSSKHRNMNQQSSRGNAVHNPVVRKCLSNTEWILSGFVLWPTVIFPSRCQENLSFFYK